MRIIGGIYSGRVFKPPVHLMPTRPTTDRTREALFNILMNTLDFEEVSMLELFGGTGAVSLEFISRGCKDVTYVDQHHRCYLWFKSLIMDLGYLDQCTILKIDVARYIKKADRKFDLIFADPPYDLEWIPKMPGLIGSAQMLADNGRFVLEHDKRFSFEETTGYEQSRQYGQSILTFFRKAEESSEEG